MLLDYRAVKSDSIIPELQHKSFIHEIVKTGKPAEKSASLALSKCQRVTIPAIESQGIEVGIGSYRASKIQAKPVIAILHHHAHILFHGFLSMLSSLFTMLFAVFVCYGHHEIPRAKVSEGTQRGPSNWHGQAPKDVAKAVRELSLAVNHGHLRISLDLIIIISAHFSGQDSEAVLRCAQCKFICSEGSIINSIWNLAQHGFAR